MLVSKINILGMEIDNVTFEDVIQKVIDKVETNTLSYVVTPNVDHIISIQKDESLKTIYKNAFLVLPDGVPLLWAARFLGTPFKEKISGADLFPEICRLAEEKEYKIFLLGGLENVARKAAMVLRKRYPQIKIVGTYTPPFGFENDEDESNRIVLMIRNVKPNILFIGCGAPKSEKWIWKYKDIIRVPLIFSVGGTFDFVSGRIKRAPRWMQKIGLEWFWRLYQEPKRLWRRYLINDMPFFWLILKQRLSQNRKEI